MLAWFFIGGILHLCVLVAAVRFLFSERAWTAVLCQLVLGFYLITLWSLQNAQGSYGSILSFVVLGPYLGPFILFHIADNAPAIAYTALGVGAIIGLLVWVLSGRGGRTRLAAMLGQLTFAVVSWLSAEALVETTLRTRAAEQFASEYCIVSRSSVPQMIRFGTTDEWVRGTHATLVDGQQTYTWSFDEGSFVLQKNANYILSDPALSRCR